MNIVGQQNESKFYRKENRLAQKPLGWFRPAGSMTKHFFGVKIGSSRRQTSFCNKWHTRLSIIPFEEKTDKWYCVTCSVVLSGILKANECEPPKRTWLKKDMTTRKWVEITA